jgi:hypothetical protein
MRLALRRSAMIRPGARDIAITRYYRSARIANRAGA